MLRLGQRSGVAGSLLRGFSTASRSTRSPFIGQRSFHGAFGRQSSHFRLVGLGSVALVIGGTAPYASCSAVAEMEAPALPKTVTRVTKNETVGGLQGLLIKARTLARYAWRIMLYCVLGFPAVALVPTSYALSKTGIVPDAEDWCWHYAIWAIELLGPCFIKFAQWASTRPDLYPPRLIEKLRKLQDDVPVRYSMSAVQEVMREAFGDDWMKYLTLEEKPLGAGCVAQVFKGILRKIENGVSKSTEVAVKMIHPNVEEVVEADMDLLNIIAGLIDRIPYFEMLSLGEVMREFGDMMRSQLDLRLEASNLQRFSRKFANDKWALFPSPIEGYIRKNVLVETLMQGEPIVNFMKLGDDDDWKTKLKLKLSDLGCRTVLKMVFFDNFVHGDMHPGNILVNFNSKGEPYLIILDCGIVYSAKSETDHKNLVQICLSFMKHDGLNAGRLMIDNSKNTKTKNADEFCKGVQKLIDDTEEMSYFEHLGDYVVKICDLAQAHMVRLDPAYFHLAMALKVVEGVSLALDRNLDLVTKCIPIIIKSQAMRAMGIEKFPTLEDEENEQLKPSAQKKRR